MDCDMLMKKERLWKYVRGGGWAFMGKVGGGQGICLPTHHLPLTDQSEASFLDLHPACNYFPSATPPLTNTWFRVNFLLRLFITHYQSLGESMSLSADATPGHVL
jgi:hypothetical protein